MSLHRIPRSLPSLVGAMALALGLMGTAIAQNANPTVDLQARLASKIAVAETLGFTPSLVLAVTEQDAQGLTDSQRQERDAAWQASSAFDPFKRSLQISPAAQLLRRFLAANEAYTHAYLVDQTGALVAAAPNAPRYDFATDATWQQAFNGGQGGIAVNPITEDNNAVGILIGIPVRDRNRNNQPIGVLMIRVSDSNLQGNS